MNRKVTQYSLVALVATFFWFASSAVAQVQSTITCPAGQWDVLSVSMLDPGLVGQHYHMQNSAGGSATAYKFTTWIPSENKLYYVKNPQGYPWDINLYDSNYIYQWITEVTWTDPYQYKKFNNGTGSSTADFSFRWAPRCGTPGSSNMWNPPTAGAQYNSRFEIHPQNPTQQPSMSECSLPYKESYLGYTLLELKSVASITLHDTRTNPPTTINAQDLPLQYTWGCGSEDVNSCTDREVFDYAVDQNPNPVDGLKHSYGWVKWRHYKNTNFGTGNPANWSQDNEGLEDYLVANSPVNEGTVDFPCF